MSGITVSWGAMNKADPKTKLMVMVSYGTTFCMASMTSVHWCWLPKCLPLPRKCLAHLSLFLTTVRGQVESIRLRFPGKLSLSSMTTSHHSCFLRSILLLEPLCSSQRKPASRILICSLSQLGVSNRPSICIHTAITPQSKNWQVFRPMLFSNLINFHGYSQRTKYLAANNRLLHSQLVWHITTTNPRTMSDILDFPTFLFPWLSCSLSISFEPCMGLV